MIPLRSAWPWWQQGPQTFTDPQASVWPLVAAWATDINTDPGCGRTIAPDGSARAPTPNSTKWWSRLQASMALSANRSQTSIQLLQGFRLKLAQQVQPSPQTQVATRPFTLACFSPPSPPQIRLSQPMDLSTLLSFTSPYYICSPWWCLSVPTSHIARLGSIVAVSQPTVSSPLCS